MKILVIGSGGREHALVWKLAQSEENTLFAAPGNAGIAKDAVCIDIKADDVTALVDFAQKQAIELVVVGPEAPLAMGIVDQMREAGIDAFGPTRRAAQLESSKLYSKEFCQRHNIPTASFDICKTPEEVRAAAENRQNFCVVKADGLAAGKGVFVCDTSQAVETSIDAMFVNQSFGDAAASVIVEDRLVGEEASILILVDGSDYVILESSQDHKAIYDGDKGPNTGGMGAYCPAPVIDQELRDKIEESVVIPTVNGMKSEGNEFTGVLYAGMMIVDRDPWVLEYNVRFGDPETQPVLMRLTSELAPLLKACATGNLAAQPALTWSDDPAVCVVLASGGYPGTYQKGYEIRGLDQIDCMDDVIVFHAGTKQENDKVVTSGGRVLGVTSIGKDIKHACAKVYEAVEKIRFDGCYYRNDIAHRALNRR